MVTIEIDVPKLFLYYIKIIRRWMLEEQMYRVVDDRGTFMYTERGKTYFILDEAIEYALWMEYLMVVPAEE